MKRSKIYLLSVLIFTTFISKITFSQQFTEQTISPLPLTDVYGASVDWGDYDNDGDLDIVITGYSISEHISKIYRNDGPNIFTEQPISLTGAGYGSVKWGDYDNDGYLDLILSVAFSGGSPRTIIYRNNGDNTFTEKTGTGFILAGVSSSSVAWGDYDNDGDLDIIINWYDIRYDHISKIYKNNGNNTFTEQTSISLTGVNL